MASVKGRLPVADYQASSGASGIDTGPDMRLRAMSASAVAPRKLEWLWPGRIPLGKVTLLDGDPGLGKSTLTLDVAARVSRGSEWPDTEEERQPAGVVLVSAEDDAADTIIPRLMAARADLDRISIVEAFEEGGVASPVELPRDLSLLEDQVRGCKALLLVLDPLVAFLDPNIKSSVDHNVRTAIAPLATLAANTGAAILATRHLNKEQKNTSALYRGGGSIAFVAAARSGLLVTRDEKDRDRRILSQTKANLSPESEHSSLGFSLESETVPTQDGDMEVGRVLWQGFVDVTADESLGAPRRRHRGRPGGKTDQCVELIKKMLGEGPQKRVDLLAAVKENGLSDANLRDAGQWLKVEFKRDAGFDNKGTTWSLPHTYGVNGS